MKKILIPSLCAVALLLGNCKKEEKAPADDPSTGGTNNNPNNNPGNPSNPGGTSNNGIVIAAFKWGAQTKGVMRKIDLETKATTDLSVPFCEDDYFDVSPDGKNLVYMLQYTDTLIFMYNIANGSKTPLFIKTSEISFPAGVHFNADGSKILFVNKNKIYSISASGSATQAANLVSTLSSEVGGPYTWTSDGKKLIAGGFSGNTNTSAHNICYADVASGTVTRVSNGIVKNGNVTDYGHEITQAQNTKEPNSAGAVIAQNGFWGNVTYGYRGWTTDGNIYYYSNKDVYQLSGQSPAGTNSGVLFNLASPSKTEDSPAYTGMRVVQISSDGKKYAAFTAALNGKLKIFNFSDNAELSDISALENAANKYAGIRFANK